MKSSPARTFRIPVSTVTAISRTAGVSRIAHLRPPSISDSALVLAALGSLASVVFLGWVHFDDLFNIRGIEAVRTVQAKYMNLGDVFPPLREGNFYGATRYMPLPVAMHAALSHLTGDYLISGKILGASVGVLLFLLAFGLIVQAGLPRMQAFGFAACVAITEVAITSFTGLGADAVPVLLQVSALAIIVNRRNRIHVALAALFCAFALLAKIAALWGGIAIVVWMLINERRLLRIFVPVWLGATAIGLVGIDLASGGSLFATMESLLLSGSTLDPHRVFIGLLRTFYVIEGFAPPILLLLPLALAIRPRGEDLTLYWWGLLVAFGLLIGMMIERSSAENHVIDVIVLSVLSLGAAIGSRWQAIEEAQSRIELRKVTTFVLLFALIYGWLMGPRNMVLAAVDSLRQGGMSAELDPVPLEGVISSSDWVLAENPYVPFSRGQRPVVLDPFLFQRMDRIRPEWGEDLAARIRNGEFTKLVLGNDLTDTFWYTRYHFGAEVLQAMRASYTLLEVVDGYYIYERARR